MLTQPDRPSGRGLRPAPSAVKKVALEHGLEVFQPATLNDPQALARLAAARPEILVVAAYGMLLPPAALTIAPRGAVNIHASLLPHWRGAAPIQRALLAGDRETGITIMQMDAGLDTGPILSRHPVAIAKDEDAQTLHDKLAALGAQAIVRDLAELAEGPARPLPQPGDGATYARKISSQEAEIDWTRSCRDIERAVRAFRPAPGARSHLRGEMLKIWRAHCLGTSGAPGTVLAAGNDGMVVACGEGALLVSELQRAGGKKMAAADFARGIRLQPGEMLGPAR